VDQPQAHDFSTASSRKTNFVAPLFTSEVALSVNAAVDSYLGGGVPATKIVMGVRFVGTGWQGLLPPHRIERLTLQGSLLRKTSRRHLLVQRNRLKKATSIRFEGVAPRWMVGDVWTVLGDPSKPDDFYEAVAHLFQDLDRSPSSGSTQGPPFALDVDARIADLRSTGNLEKIENQMFRTSEIFQTAKLLELFTRLFPKLADLTRLSATDCSKSWRKLLTNNSTEG
jgi:hypothetical protein